MPGRVSIMAVLVWISASAFLKNTVIGRVSVWFKWCGNTSKNGGERQNRSLQLFLRTSKGAGRQFADT